MRLWSLHPAYLDASGLVAVWREGLLAQNVLKGDTRGYRDHPQLIRFKLYGDSLEAIGAYLHHVCVEADLRGYRFRRKKIVQATELRGFLPVTRGQLHYEFGHLKKKLAVRSCHKLALLPLAGWDVVPHPVFFEIEGPVEPWERVSTD